MIAVETIGFTSGNVVPTQFQYREERPLEIVAVFDEHAQFTGDSAVEWVFSRSILSDGLTEKAGTGDVSFCPGDEGFVTMSLESPDGSMELQFSYEDLSGFVTLIYDAVDEDEERDIVIDALENWVSGLYKEGA